MDEAVNEKAVDESPVNEEVVDGGTNPVEKEYPTISVWRDDSGEIQIGANYRVSLTEIQLTLEVAAKKLELLGFQQAAAMATQQRGGNSIIIPGMG